MTIAFFRQDGAFWQMRSSPGVATEVQSWLIAVVVAVAAFMEVLDTSIANVALPHIAGNLGASMDQGTWVLTTYLVSNAIVLPITGWLTSILGRKRFFLICITLFSIASFMCGIAPSFGFLLFARVIQGAAGASAADGPGHHGRFLSTQVARNGFRDLWSHRHRGACAWAHPRRIDHR